MARRKNNSIKTRTTCENPITENEQVYGMDAPTPLKSGERPDWQRNHELILYHTSKFISENKRFPSARILADRTGLDKNTVYKHLQTYDANRHKKKFKIMLDRAATKLIEDYLKYGENAELLFKYIGDWRDPLSIEHSGTVDFRTAKEKIDDSTDNRERTGNFVKYLSLQNDRRQFIAQN
jgi:hypothetical protein